MPPTSPDPGRPVVSDAALRRLDTMLAAAEQFEDALAAVEDSIADPAIATAVAELDVRIADLRQLRLADGEITALIDEALDARHALLHPEAG